jgi:putative aldouronate transport system permease protein
MIMSRNSAVISDNAIVQKAEKKKRYIDKIIRSKELYILALPGILFFILFKYVPMWGLVIAFQDYSPYQGILHSPWVGLEHFRNFFTDDAFWSLLRNTLTISILNLLLFFPAPIFLSLMLNELRNERFKKLTQTVIYFPHFLSWVIIYGLSYILLNQTNGAINLLVEKLGADPIPFLMSTKLFYPLLIVQNIWKDAGWGTVIFLAALSGIDPGLYEAAKIDGAGRFKQIWYVTLPGISGVIITLLILRLGQVMDAGFEQVYLMTNSAVSDIADIFDTYVYRNGVLNGAFSYSATVGLFKSLIATVMVIAANKLSKAFGQEGLY